MALKCKTHARDAKAVCHHCGTPLCNVVDISNPAKWKESSHHHLTLPEICGLQIDDFYFHTPDKKKPIKAFHCESCLRQFHQEFVDLFESYHRQISYDINSDNEGAP